jgi:hypothetical protein
MKIYIDESGLLGVKSRDKYFVLAALVCHTKIADKKLKQLGKNIYKKYLAPNNLQEIHATHTSFPVKQKVLNTIARIEDITIYYLIVEQKKIHKSLILYPNICYNYLIGLLLEDIILKCKDNVDIILDNHSTKVGSLNSLHEYLKIKAFTEWRYNYNFTSIFMDSHKVWGIQMVDVIANSIFTHYNYKKSALYKITKHYHKTKKFPY